MLVTCGTVRIPSPALNGAANGMCPACWRRNERAYSVQNQPRLDGQTIATSANCSARSRIWSRDCVSSPHMRCLEGTPVPSPNSRRRTTAWRLVALAQAALLAGSVFIWTSSAAAAETTPSQLNGSSQYATLGTASDQLRSARSPLELWFKRTGAGSRHEHRNRRRRRASIPLITKGRAEAETAAADINYFFGIDATSGKLVADFEEAQVAQGGTSPGLNHPITGTAVIAADSTWHHAAATYDGTTWNLYLDGALDGTLAVSRAGQCRDQRSRPSVGSTLSTRHHRRAARLLRRRRSTRSGSGARPAARPRSRPPRTPRSRPRRPASSGVWNLNEGTGASLADSSGNSVTGADRGHPHLGRGLRPLSPRQQCSPAQRLEPVRDARDGSAAPVSATFTVELWFKRTGAGVGRAPAPAASRAPIPLDHQGSGRGRDRRRRRQLLLRHRRHQRQARRRLRGGAGAQGGPARASTIRSPAPAVIAADSTWHHAAATYDGTTWNLYLDGSLDGTLAVGRPANAATNVMTSVGRR